MTMTPHREIGSSSTDEICQLQAMAMEHIIPHFANNASLLAHGPKIFTRGEGCYLYDVKGRRYLDTFASLLTTICGHHRIEVKDAIKSQLDDLEFFPNYEDAFTIPLINLAKKLSEIMPGDLSVSFFVNSGSEANETAIKMARQYHVHQNQKHRYKVIARKNSYHGTTLGTVSTTGITWFREYFEPLLPGVVFVPAARRHNQDQSLEQLRDTIEFEGPQTISAIIMDPIPGSNTGYPLPPEGYLQGVRQLCDKHGIILIFDEVQTGFGKTGKWFACDHWDVVPDIMTIGKGFTGGYVPLGATVTTQEIADVFRVSGQELRSGSTYGGHTIACAATLANIKIIEDEQLVLRAHDLGCYLEEGLEQLSRHSIVSHISGIGLLRSVFLTHDPDSSKDELPIGTWIRDWCYERGIILRNNGNILVLAPALIITKEQIDDICEHIDHAIEAAMVHFELS